MAVRSLDLPPGKQPPALEDYVLVSVGSDGTITVKASLQNQETPASVALCSVDGAHDLRQALDLASQWASRFGFATYYIQVDDAE